MTTVDASSDTDLTAADVAWDIDTILPSDTTPADLFDRADVLADELATLRGRVGDLDAGGLAAAMRTLADIQDLLSRGGYHAMLAFSTATDDPARGAASRPRPARGPRRSPRSRGTHGPLGAGSRWSRP